LFRDWKYSGNSIDIENPEVKKHYEDQKRKYGFTGDLKGVSVTYVGNAGFLIKAGDKKILMDATFKGYAGQYQLPASIQEQIALGRPPFDGLDLILATHAHGDHFDPDLTRQCLQNNPKAVFGSTSQVTSKLTEFPDRVVTFNPTQGNADCKESQGINIEALYLPHGAKASDGKELLNYGYIVSVNGIRIFHTGDIDLQQFSYDDFRGYQLPEKKIDLAFIQHFLLTPDPGETKFVREGIGSQYVLPSHYHYTVPPLDTSLVLRNYPDAVLFRNELQNWIMPAGK
jgi:L-ascorbate metabolism protein UlaG (beta-lactamase superfamily)